MRRRHSFIGPLLSIALAAFAVGACSGQSSEGEATTQAALADTTGSNAGLTNSCDPGFLSWNLGDPTKKYTCAGGVEYRIFNSPCEHDYKPGDPQCPPTPTWDGTYTYPPNACNFADATNGTSHVHALIPTHSEIDCCDIETAPGHHCPKPPCHSIQVESTTCAQMVQDAVNWYHGAYVGKTFFGVTYNYGQNVTASNASSGSNGYCDYDLQNLPVNWHVNTADLNHCGSTQTKSADRPKYLGCTIGDPWSTTCTCQTYADDQSCQETTHHLVDPGKYTIADIPKPANIKDWDSASSFCETDEDKPITPATAPTEASAKYQRLLLRLNAANNSSIADVDDSDVAKLIIAEMKLLFEMFGDSLKPQEQKDVVQLYIDHPGARSTPVCGVTFVPPNTAQCTTDAKSIAKLNAEMELCARVTGGHVPPAVRNIDVVKSLCITQVAADIGALRASLMVNGGDDGTANAVGVAGSASNGLTDGGDAGTSEGGVVDASDAGPAGAGPVQDPNDVCGFKLYRAQYDTFVTNSVEGRFEDLKDPRKPSDQPEIVNRLMMLDAWYKAISTNLWPYDSSEPNATQVRAVAWQHANDAERTLWQFLYRSLFPNGAVQAADGGTIALGPDGALPDAGPGGTIFDANALAALVTDALDADRAVLGMLFPYSSGSMTQGAPPLQSAPLLLLLGDVLEAMSQRMRDVGIYHDMGCAYLGCGPAVQSELVWLTELLGAIPDVTPPDPLHPDPLNLSTVLDNAHIARDQNNSPVVGQAWLSVYDGIRTQHAAIESAYQNAIGAGTSFNYLTDGMDTLLEGSLNKVPQPAQHFSGLVQLARGAALTYAKTGLFNPTARNRLPAGVSQDNIDSIRSLVSQSGGNLLIAASTFDQNLTQIANGVIQEMNANTGMINSFDLLKQKGAAYDQTMGDLDGQRESLRENYAQFGAYAANYPTQTAFDTDSLITGSSYGPWMFDTASARASGPIAKESIPQMAAAQSTGLAKGSIVTIQVPVGQKWAPTCALHKKKNLPDAQTATGAKINADNALTGPEGYTATLASTGYSAQGIQGSITQSNTTNLSAEIKTCSGAHAAAGIDFFGSGAQVYTDTSVCGSIGNTTSFGVTGSATASSGSDTKGSMSFAAGLRLDNTPVPDAPVGALLAIVTPANHPEIWTQVSVVQAPGTGIVLSDASDLYLLSNDIQAPSGDSDCKGDTKDQLQVTVTTAQHAGNAIGWVTNGLATLSSFLDGLSTGDPNSATPTAATGSLIAQGHLTPNQSAEIRSTAMLKLVGECKGTSGAICDTSKLPATVLEFINNMIDRGLETLEMKLEIIQSIRSLNGLSLELQQMIDDYNASLAQSHVAALIPQWTLRNLDTNTLQSQTAQLVNLTTYDLYPVLQLRFPELFDANSPDGIPQDQVLQQQFQTLVNAHWDAPVDTLARAAAAAATELYTKTQNLVPYYPQLKTDTVALDFVSTKWKPLPPPAAPWQPPQWAVADGRSALAWQQATTGDHIATFRVLPEDLYHKDNILPGLLCTEEAPVILDFAVFLSGKNMSSKTISLFAGALKATSYSSPQLTFPMGPTLNARGEVVSPGGPISFELSNLDWATLKTPIYANSDDAAALFGVPSGSAGNVYNPAKNSNGKGLSLFSDFTVDFSGLYDPAQIVQPDNNPFTYADHITLVFNVQYRETAMSKALTWVGTCH